MVFTPDLDLPEATQTGNEGGPRINGIHTLIRYDFAAVPKIAAVRRQVLQAPTDQYSVSDLFLTTYRRFQRPAQPGRGVIDAQRPLSVFTAQPLDANGRRCRIGRCIRDERATYRQQHREQACSG